MTTVAPIVTSTTDSVAVRFAAPPRLSYLPAWDGLRALAVVVVLLFHFQVPGFAGGLLGVDIFFVISGFLITYLLLGEVTAHGRIAYRRFIGRRMTRLYPAVLATVVGTWVVCLALGGIRTPGRDETFASLTYTVNWLSVLRPDTTSYFAHLWSLGIEQQFYLTWPIILLGLFIGRPDPGQLLRRCLALAALVIVARAAYVGAGFAWRPDGWDSAARDPFLFGEIAHRRIQTINWAYFALWFRVDGIFLGAAAAIWAAGGATMPRRVAAVLSGVCSVLLIVAIAQAKPGTEALYVVWIPLVGVATAGLLAASWSARSMPWSRALGVPPLTLIGRWSYSIYLIHIPVWEVLGQRIANHQLRVLIATAITLAAAGVLHTVVEKPANLALRRRLRIG